MTTISFVHTKGGVGKTTSSIYMALAAWHRGIDVCVVDADPQESALQWAADTVGVPFKMYKANRNLTIPDHTLVLVDTPPGTSDVIELAINAADLVIIPTGASPYDVRRVWPTLQITEHKKHQRGVLLTQVDLRARLHQEVRSTLTAQEVPVYETVICAKQQMRRDYGTVPKTLNGYDDLLSEVSA
ncbi:ParA-like partition protein [Mycobacterium phage Echild]|uniref:ParA-like partition protein n=1 Tax=Mycobacterium phage Echild TaxID=1437839 RepID=UPI0003E350A4|nr:ParA-like partition protein [Mycobacterium phage Echild]AHG24255.1 ParA [Mycobacterium phage Echild]